MIRFWCMLLFSFSHKWVLSLILVEFPAPSTIMSTPKYTHVLLAGPRIGPKNVKKKQRFDKTLHQLSFSELVRCLNYVCICCFPFPFRWPTTSVYMENDILLPRQLNYYRSTITLRRPIKSAIPSRVWPFCCNRGMLIATSIPRNIALLSKDLL